MANWEFSNNFKDKNIPVKVGVATKRGGIRNVSFIVDTGASVTAVSRGDLVSIGYSEDLGELERIDNRKLLIASGSYVSLTCVRLRRIVVFGYIFKNLTLVITEGHDVNLLGMDIFKCFNWNFNSDDSIYSVSRTVRKDNVPEGSTVEKLDFYAVEEFRQ
jgi:predicted aspartyl protease